MAIHPSMPGEAPRHHRLRNTVLILAVVIGIFVVALAAVLYVAIDDHARGPNALSGTTTDLDSLPQTIPFEMIAGHMLVEAGLPNTDDAMPIIFDTGAPMFLSDTLAEQAGGGPVGTISSASIDGETTTQDVVVLESLTMGGARFSDVGAVQGFVEPGNPLYCVSGNGLIGASLMQDVAWQIDYDAATITIAPSTDDLEHVEGAIGIPFSTDSLASPSPVIELPAGGGTLRLMVDTGSDGWLTINPADLQGTGALVQGEGLTHAILASGISGTFETVLTWTQVDLSLGGQVLADLPIATTESITADQGNIGNGFLSHYVVTIDWPEQMLYLDPVTESPQPDAPWSLAPGWDGERVVVGAIARGAPGTDGLKLGTPVSAIDGVDLTGATFEDFCALSTSDPAPSSIWTIEADPATVEVTEVGG